MSFKFDHNYLDESTNIFSSIVNVSKVPNSTYEFGPGTRLQQNIIKLKAKSSHFIIDE